MRIAVIIPSLNEASCILQTLEPLQNWRHKGHIICLVDGGSNDNTVSLSESLVDKVVRSDKGRALQMNTGSEQVDADILLFLHADTLIGPDDDEHILHAIDNNAIWGRFNVRFSSKALIFRVIAALMNVRSCLTSIVTGDQGIFVRKDIFDQVGRFPQLELMEDIALSCRLRSVKRAICLPQRLLTSSRRWESGGIIRTILLMWYLRLAYFLGVPAKTLAKRYR